MDDFLTERDQWDALKQWLKENGPWIVAGVALAVAGIYGWRLWQERVTTHAQTAAVRFTDVLTALDANDRARALELTGQLRKDYGDTPYVDQANLSVARDYVEKGEMDDAAKLLRTVMTESNDQELRHVAALRLARVQISQGKADDALATLKQSETGTAFDARYSEVRGDALVAKGDRQGALTEYRKAQGATEPGLVDEGLLELKINDLAAPDDKPAEPKTAESAASRP